MEENAQKLALHLLSCGAVRLSPQKPFTWASGWKSPIYCDNRRTLSHPTIRQFIYTSLADLIRKNFAHVETVAGVATGAIAHGALTAEVLEKPFVYVRTQAKEHGMKNRVEGQLPPRSRVVVVEDLISTGMSSLRAVEALRKETQAEIMGMVAIFSYQFPQAEQAFRQAGVKLLTVSQYSDLLEAAIGANYINSSELETLKKWRSMPDTWGRE